MTSSRVTLLTDFGTADGYVGAMKGVIASILPGVLIDDIAHDIPAGDITSAAWCIANFWRCYPEGTVHICVVDPGVGSGRRAIAVQAAGQLFVAPDNGLLTHVLQEQDAAVVEIANPRFMRRVVSHTFHGRDVFAPVGAHLARGLTLEDLGSPVRDPVRLTIPSAHVSTRTVRGEVVHADRFGNLITNIPAAVIRTAAGVRVSRATSGLVPIVRTYADAEEGELVALIGSVGVLEIAVRNGSAAEVLRAGRGLEVVVLQR